MRRVPNRIANIASSAAMYKRAVAQQRRVLRADAPLRTLMLIATALNCSAMYGIAAVTAMTVTSAARPCDLPKREAMKSAIEVMLRCLATTVRRWNMPLPNTNSRIGPEIDRQVRQARSGRAADRAVERPRRAVDRERQAVDERPQPGAARIQRPPVAVVGQREQPGHVAERYQQQQPACDHRRASRWLERILAQPDSVDDSGRRQSDSSCNAT